jgi:hypothetical protein
VKTTLSLPLPPRRNATPWHAEWHFDPEGVTFSDKMFGGRLWYFSLTKKVAAIPKKCGILCRAVTSITATATELCQLRHPTLILSRLTAS